MKKLILVLAIIFVSCGNTNANTEIDDVCKWAETKVVKSMIDIKSNKLDEQNSNESRIEKYAKVYHYLDCSRFKWDYYELFPNYKTV